MLALRTLLAVRGLLTGLASLELGGLTDVSANAEQLNRMVTYESHLGDRLEVTVLRNGAEMTVAVIFEVGP